MKVQILTDPLYLLYNLSPHVISKEMQLGNTSRLKRYEVSLQ